MKYYIWAIGIFLCSDLVAQNIPTSFQIQNCSTTNAGFPVHGDVNGMTFTDSGLEINGCKCYDGPYGFIYKHSPISWDYGDGSTCTDNTPINTYHIACTDNTECNILNAVSYNFSCGIINPSFTLASPIPTLSQWSLIIMGLLLLIVSVRFKQAWNWVTPTQE